MSRTEPRTVLCKFMHHALLIFEVIPLSILFIVSPLIKSQRLIIARLFKGAALIMGMHEAASNPNTVSAAAAVLLWRCGSARRESFQAKLGLLIVLPKMPFCHSEKCLSRCMSTDEWTWQSTHQHKIVDGDWQIAIYQRLSHIYGFGLSQDGEDCYRCSAVIQCQDRRIEVWMLRRFSMEFSVFLCSHPDGMFRTHIEWIREMMIDLEQCESFSWKGRTNNGEELGRMYIAKKNSHRRPNEMSIVN